MRYNKQMRDLDAWAALHGLPVGSALAECSQRILNQVLVARLQQLVVERASPAAGQDLLAGYMHAFQHTRGLLAEAEVASRRRIDARVHVCTWANVRVYYIRCIFFLT